MQAQSAPPVNNRFPDMKKRKQYTQTDFRSTRLSMSKNGACTSFLGKKSVDDLWDDLFHIKNFSANLRASKEIGFNPEQREAIQSHLRSRSVADVSALANMGINQITVRKGLLDSSGVARVNRRVASVNIPGIISRFKTRGTGGLKETSKVDNQDPASTEQSPAKDSLTVARETPAASSVGGDTREAVDTRPRQPDNRRYCIVDNFLFNSARPLSDKLNACIERFKSTILDCERDMNELTDNVRMNAFSHVYFVGGKKFDQKGYLHLFQSIIEMMISHFRGVDIVRSLSRRSNMSYSSSKNPLTADIVFLGVRQLFNIESILLLFDLYFKILILATNLDRAEHIGRLCLSLAYIADIKHYKIEAYYMLAQVYEKKRMTENALLCYTRSMQICIEANEKSRELYMCDKIGLQLYYLNEMDLAKEYHDRMLVSYEEPQLSNAILRSKEILEIDYSTVKQHYLLRDHSTLDKYRAADMLMNLHVSPCDVILKVEVDDTGSPVVLMFVDLMLANQRRDMESIRLKKMSFIKDSLFGKPNRECEIPTKKPESNTKVIFTNEGKKILIDCNEYIPKISANLLGMNLKIPLRMTHQKNNNNLLNYLNQNCNNSQDFDKVKSKAAEIQKKNSTEDVLMFLTRARYFVMRKINEVANVKASRYHRMLRPTIKAGGSSAFLIT